MRILKIETKGLKTPSSTVALGAATLLRGPVGAGKTAIADAIQFAVLGSVPRIGRNEAATSRLMRGPGMTATVELEDGRTFGRSLSREGQRLQNAADASWAPRKAKTTEISDMIRGLFGGSADEAAENLDILRLLGRSGADLAKTIEVLLDSGGLDVDARIARGLALWCQRMDSQRKMVDGLLQPIPPTTQASMALVEKPLAEQIRASIVKAIDWAGDEKRKAATACREMIEARGAMEDRVINLAAPAEGAAALKARKAEAERRRTELRTKIDLVARSAEDRRQVELAIERAIDGCQTATAALLEAEALLQTVAGLRERAEAIVDPAEVPAPTIREVDPTAWDDRRAEAQGYRDAANAVVDPPAPEALQLEILPEVIGTQKEWLDHHAAETAVERAKKNPWREVEAIASELEGYGFECEAGPLDNCRPFQRLRDLAREHGGDLKAMEAALEQTTIALEDAKARAAERQAERDAAQARNARREEAHGLAVAEANAAAMEVRKERDRLRALAKEIDDSITYQFNANVKLTREVNDNARRAHAEATAARRATIDANTAERRRLLAEADRIVGAHRAAEARKAETERALAEAQARLSGLADALPIDVPTAETEIGSLTAEITDIAAKLELVATADALRTELQKMIAAIDKLTADQEVYGAAEWALKRLRDEDMESRVGGLEGRMRRFLEAAGRAEVPFLRCTKGQAEFGWRVPAGDEVMVEALSGGQAVLYRAALAYAVVMSRGPEVRLLLVELAEASDGATEQAVLRALQAVAYEIQVIVTTCVPVEAPEGWTVIDVAPAREEVVA